MPTHQRIRMFYTRETYPKQTLDNDLCQAVRAANTLYVRGQVGTDFAGNLVGLSPERALKTALAEDRCSEYRQVYKQGLQDSLTSAEESRNRLFSPDSTTGAYLCEIDRSVAGYAVIADR